MENTKDADEFVVPPVRASTDSNSYGAVSRVRSQLSGYDEPWESGASAASSRRSLVESPNYRSDNLFNNHISMRDLEQEEFPVEIAKLVDRLHKTRDSPGPSPSQVKQDLSLKRLGLGTSKSSVEEYFLVHVFPRTEPSDIVQRTMKLPMVKHAVPDVKLSIADGGTQSKVSTPVPDMLYGYNSRKAFPGPMGYNMVANNDGLMFPFLVIEFKGDDGSMSAATNQCLGGSATCVNISERLHRQLRQLENKAAKPSDSAAFSIALNGSEARLYVSWKHNELKYYTQTVRSFHLQQPDHYVQFRTHVLNIIDWGKDERLKEIQRSLDSLLKESIKKASQQAKARPTPSDDSASDSSNKRSRKANK